MSEIIINSFDGSNYNQLFPTGNSKTEISSTTNNYFDLPAQSNLADVLNWIGKYNLCWWRRRTPATSTYTLRQTAYQYQSSSCYDPKITFYSYSINQNTGNIIYTQTGQVSPYGKDNAGAKSVVAQVKANIGKVLDIVAQGDQILSKVQITSQTSISAYYSENREVVVFNLNNGLYTLSTSKSTVPASSWTYLQSKNTSQYPASGTSGGYEYERLRIPFLNALFLTKTANYL